MNKNNTKSFNLNDVRNELCQANEVLTNFISEEKNIIKIVDAAYLLLESFNKGNKVISCGNGGSHCDAMHFAEELTGRFRDNRSALPAISISDPSHISCVANDYGFDYIFSRFIEGVGTGGDVLFAISTSGNSKNIIEAMKAAEIKKMKTILLTGNDGGKLSGIADVEIRVPHFGYADRIQEMHIKIIHIIIHLIEKGTDNNK